MFSDRVPILAICLGAQLVTEKSEEGALCDLEVVLGGLPFCLSIPCKFGLLAAYVLGSALHFRISLPELWKKPLTLVTARPKGEPATESASLLASNRFASQAETDTIPRTE